MIRCKSLMQTSDCRNPSPPNVNITERHVWGVPPHLLLHKTVSQVHEVSYRFDRHSLFSTELAEISVLCPFASSEKGPLPFLPPAGRRGKGADCSENSGANFQP